MEAQNLDSCVDDQLLFLITDQIIQVRMPVILETIRCSISVADDRKNDA